MAVKFSRAERVAAIRQAEFDHPEMTNQERATLLGIAVGTYSDYKADPDGSKVAARKASYTGTCVECGGPTDGSNGRKGAPLRCRWCALGVPPQDRQRPSQPSVRRTHPIRLGDLPFAVRIEGARVACRIEQGDLERREIMLAAISPSETTYWIAPSALGRVAELMAQAE